jgi:hypothetical protein
VLRFTQLTSDCALFVLFALFLPALFYFRSVSAPQAFQIPSMSGTSLPTRSKPRPGRDHSRSSRSRPPLPALGTGLVVCLTGKTFDTPASPDVPSESRLTRAPIAFGGVHKYVCGHCLANRMIWS